MRLRRIRRRDETLTGEILATFTHRTPRLVVMPAPGMDDFARDQFILVPRTGETVRATIVIAGSKLDQIMRAWNALGDEVDREVFRD